MTERVGFIGVGRMGAPIVRRLLAHGYEVVLRDVSAAALAPFRRQPGVTIAGSPSAVAAAVPVVLLSLPRPELLDEVVLGADGIASANGPVTVIDLSTSGVSATRRVASAAKTRGLRFLDAPVSGGVTGAETGTLAVMVAGDPDLHNRHRALFSVIGRNVFHVGAEPGQGQAMKLANNLLSIAAVVLTSEAMAVATKVGIEPSLAIDVINASTGRNSATQDKFPRAVLTGTFDFGAQLSTLLKDLTLFAELANEIGVPTLLAPAVVNAWRVAEAHGLADADFTAIAQLYERWAGVEIRGKKSKGGTKGPTS